MAFGVPAITGPEDAVFFVVDTLGRTPLEDEQQRSGVYRLKDDRFCVLDKQESAASVAVALEFMAPSLRPFTRVDSGFVSSEDGIQFLITEVAITKNEVTQKTFERLSGDYKRIWSSFYGNDVLNPNNFMLDPNGEIVRKPESLDPSHEGALDPRETIIDPNDPHNQTVESKPERGIYRPDHTTPHDQPRSPRGGGGIGRE